MWASLVTHAIGGNASGVSTAGGIHMKATQWFLRICLLTFFGRLLTGGLVVQVSRPNSQFSGTRSNDTESIGRMMNDIVQGVRQGDLNRIRRYFHHDLEAMVRSVSSAMARPFSTQSSLLNRQHAMFSVDGLNISAVGELARVTGNVAFPREKARIPVALGLKKSKAGRWEIDSVGCFLVTATKFIDEYGIQGNPARGTLSTSPTYSSHLLIPYVFGKINDTPLWQIARSEAVGATGKDLFSSPIDVDRAVYGANGNAAFGIDVYWQRIVYGDLAGGWLKSYGDKAGDYHFNEPRGLQVTEVFDGASTKWLIDVADKANAAVVQLQYDPPGQTITYLQSFTNNIHRPVDVVALPWSDKMIVADAGMGDGGALLYMDQSGNLLATITGYTYGGVTHPISNPVRALFKFDLDIVFIDGDQNAIVAIDPNDWYPAGGIPAAKNFVKFDAPSKLNSLGTQYYYTDFYVTDCGLNCVHKFSADGEYLASFSSFSSNLATSPNEFSGRTEIALFNSPVMFGSSNKNSYRGYYHLDMNTLSDWGGRGFQCFVDGCDIISPSADLSPNGINFNYTLTNCSWYTSEVLDATPTVVKDLNPSDLSSEAGRITDFVTYSDLGGGVFTWRATAIPLDNASYYSTDGGVTFDFRQNPVAVEIPFITYPSLSFPPQGLTDIGSTPELSWSRLNIASKYRLQVSTDADFGSFVFNQEVNDQPGSSISQTIGPLAPCTEYYWRVNATYSLGTGGWSPPRHFTTGADPYPELPVQLSPQDGNANLSWCSTVPLVWACGAGVSSYTVFVSTYSNAEGGIQIEQSGCAQYNLDVSTMWSTTFYWKVRANGCGGSSTVSDVWSFTTYPASSPPAPVLNSPANLAQLSSTQLQLQWAEPSSSCGGYRVQVSAGSASWAPPNFVNADNVTIPVYNLSNLQVGTTYFWRVAAKNQFTAPGSENWSSVNRFTIVEGGGGGGGGCCPYLFTSTEGGMRIENNILPQSEFDGHEGKDVTDFYRLNQLPAITNGRYSVQLREFEQERSFIDQIRLIAVDHYRNTNIAVKSSGDIVEYIEPYTLDTASDRLVKMLTMNGEAFSLEGGQEFEVPFKGLPSRVVSGSSKIEGGVIIGGWGLGNGKFYPDCIPKEQRIGKVTTDQQGARYGSSPFSLRELPTKIFASLDRIVAAPRISFEGKVMLDYANLGVRVADDFETHDLPLVSANSSIEGDVSTILRSVDEVYSTLTPGGTITLEFAIPPLQDGKTRDFILASRGRYEHIESPKKVIPGSYALYQNFPNPGNPQTAIRYDIPEDVYVRLTIFDPVGRELARIVDKYMPAGSYALNYETANLASGVYFYSLTAGSYHDVKKMIVTK